MSVKKETLKLKLVQSVVTQPIKILLTDKETLKKETIKYLEIFKDHPYVFNLGHGILPETNPEMVDHLVKIVKEFK